MSVTNKPAKATFGLLPEPERNPGSFITSGIINGIALTLMIILGATAKQVVDQHRYEETLLVLPSKPTPPPPKVKVPPPPKVEEQPKLQLEMEAPKINMPRPEPKPDLKPIQAEVKVALPAIKEAKPAVILGAQPKSAITGAAMPAQDNQVKFSPKPVHFGQEFGVTPNPNAKGPATVAAIGNPYGGMQGPAIAPHGKVGSTGFGDGSRIGSSAGVVGKVASAGISAEPTALAPPPRVVAGPPPTDLVVISKPQPQYTSEAKQLRVQGDVILRVTFEANGQVVVQSIVRGLGHGLDEEARRVAQQIRFRPATRNGQAVDMTTIITITFQLA